MMRDILRTHRSDAFRCTDSNVVCARNARAIIVADLRDMVDARSIIR
jgi:hypothetical protein